MKSTRAVHVVVALFAGSLAAESGLANPRPMVGVPMVPMVAVPQVRPPTISIPNTTDVTSGAVNAARGGVDAARGVVTGGGGAPLIDAIARAGSGGSISAAPPAPKTPRGDSSSG